MSIPTGWCGHRPRPSWRSSAPSATECCGPDPTLVVMVSGVSPQAEWLEPGQHPFPEPVGLLEVRVSRQDELLDADGPILEDALRHLGVAPYQRGPGPAAHEADPGPQVGSHLEIFERSIVQR